MEQNLPVIAAKRIWNMVRIAYNSMLRKGICKSKLLLLDLNSMIINHRKISGKSIANHKSFHQHYGGGGTSHAGPTMEYEFSCSNSPAFPGFQYFRKRHHHSHLFGCAQPPVTMDDDVENSNEIAFGASPAVLFPGLGQSPKVRQLRITDSPFPVRDADEDPHVDKAAEEFINRFYKEIRLQKTMSE